MGYRTYIASMPKKEYDKIKSMTCDELVNFYQIETNEGESWYKGVYEYGERLYEFGKYTDFDPPKDSLNPFFENKELMDIYDECDFNIVTKEFLAYIIQRYNDRVSDYYNDMINPFFGGKDSLLDRESPSTFLNSIKTDYTSSNKNKTFDFSKITQEEQNALYKIIEHVRSMRTEWTCLTPFDLSSHDDVVTTSWKYEYAIFELVRIYKSFDWDNNVMIYYGC